MAASRRVNPDDEDIRLAEARVLERRVKERRRADRFGRWIERGMMAVLVALYLLGFAADNRSDREATRHFGESVLVNCIKTEDLKDVIRGVLREGIEATRRLEDIPGYDVQDRREAARRARDNIARFAAQDCLSLDAVRLAVEEGLDARAVREQARRGVEQRRKEARRDAEESR